MSLLEMLSKTFFSSPEKPILSSEPEKENIAYDLDTNIPTGFYDDGSSLYSGNYGGKIKTIQMQNKLIETYRRISNYPEVSAAIDEIVDEAVFSPGNENILTIDFEADLPEALQKKISTELDIITKKLKLKKNIYNYFLTFYVDGQLNLHLGYDEENMSEGIQTYKIISPIGLIFNYDKDIWEYSNEGTGNFNRNPGSQKFKREEIIRIDSGIYSNNLILSNLNTAIKTANMLNTLEDMLIPMRFSRSVSRRIFNIDVSNINANKAEEVMKQAQAKFKYKKFYDLETGTISNQQHVASLTEDYWFPNRGGEKGTTVDTIDETGNLGELGDVLYFKRKLYTSLKVPTSRINDEGPGDSEFDYDTTSINREEIKFFNFISRLRRQFLDLFYQLLRREIISKGYIQEEEWDMIQHNIKIKFTSENAFFLKMEQERLNSQIDAFNNIEELAGKYFSYNFVFKKIFKMTEEDVKEMSEEINREKTDPVYSKFYSTEGEKDSW